MKCTECNEEVKPVVAIDLDGTLGRYHDHLLNFMSMYWDTTFRKDWNGVGNWEDFLKLPRYRYQEAKLAFRQGGLKRWMPEYPGAADTVEAVRAAGAEIWITTTRPYLRLDSVDPDTRFWLDKRGIYYDHLLYHDDKYGQLSKLVGPGRVVAVLEDLPEQYQRAQQVFGDEVPVLIGRMHNTSFRNQPRFSETTIAHNLDEARDRLVRAVKGWYNAQVDRELRNGSQGKVSSLNLDA